MKKAARLSRVSAERPTSTRASPAGQAQGGAAVKDVLLVEIDQVNRTFQYRLRSGAEDLKRSLSKDGQKEPIDLLEPKPYRIVDGFRRLEAATSLGWPSIKAIIHDSLSEDDAHTFAFVKNVVRRNLSPIDRAHAIYRAHQRGKSVEEIASHLGLSEKQVHRYEELMHFPAGVQKVLEENLVSMAHAKVLADFDPDEPESWADQCQLGGWTVPQLRTQLLKALGKKPRGRTHIHVRIDKDRLRAYAFKISRKAPRAEREKVIAHCKEIIEFLDWDR